MASASWYYVIESEDVVDDDRSFLVAFDFPFRFTPNCDTRLTSDERVIGQNLRNAVMIRLRGMPLRSSLGSRVADVPFDPNDPATLSFYIEEVLRAGRVGEPRAVLDPSPRVVDQNNAKLAVAFPFAVRHTRKWYTFFIPEEDISG